MTSIRPIWGALAILMLASAVGPGSNPRPVDAAEVGPAQRFPTGALAPRTRKSTCVLSLGLKREKAPDGIWLTATATNRSRKPIELSAPDACPSGPIRWTGLPEGYDYYRTCNKGACAGPRPPIRWTVLPGQTQELDAIIVSPGGGNCVAPLSPGTYNVAFEPPAGTPQGDALCGPVAAAIVVKGPGRTRTPRARAPASHR